MALTPELTRSLAAHVRAIALDRLPPEVIAKVEHCVLDTLGADEVSR